MSRVSEIAAQETQNILNSFQTMVTSIITAAEMERILAAFKNSGNEFYKLESFGIFLQDYVISGGEVTRLTNNTINMTALTLSYMDFIWYVQDVVKIIPSEDDTYIIYFLPALGIMDVNLTLPAGSFEIARVTVEGGAITTVEDTRGEVGGIRFQPSIIIDGGEWE